MVETSVILPPDYKPSADEEYMNEMQVEYFRQKLLDWKKSLLAQSQDTLEELRQGGLNQPDELDRASMETDKALDLLDERERTVIVLRFFQELKLQEIAQVTGENVNTVKTILYRSLKKLKLELSEGGPIRESRPSRSSETGI